MYNYEFEKLFGILLAVIILLLLIEIVLQKFFPKSKISKIPSLIVEWIQENIKI